MIENWEQFFGAVAKMREHQKVYFASRDQLALQMSKRFEEIVDDCIAERAARNEKKLNKQGVGKNGKD